MKKVILLTVVSLLVFSGGLGLSGTGLAEAEECLIKTPGSKIGKFLSNIGGVSCADTEVKAIITISKNHKINIYHPKDLPFQKPKDMQVGPPPHAQTGHPANPDFKDMPIPDPLKQDVTGAGNKYKSTTIEVIGNKTCMLWGGWYYCW